MIFRSYFDTGRIYAHTLLFAAVVLAAVMVITRRGSPARKRWMALPIGVLLHLLLDMPIDAETLWWPVLGVEFPPFAEGALVDLVAYLLRSPWVILQEMAGAIYLGYLFRRAHLRHPGPRRQLIETGTLPA